MPEALPSPWRRLLVGTLLGVLLALLAGLLIVRSDIAARREAFQAEARTAHRLLSQRMAQHEAILATLALKASAAPASTESLPVPPGFAQLLSARREPAAGLASAADTRFQVDAAEAPKGRYTLLMTHQGAAYRLQVDARRLPQDEAWPWSTEGPVQVMLEIGATPVPLQPGADEGLRPAGLTEGFRFAQPLASASQPFLLRAQRWTGPAEWPWDRLLMAVLGSAALVAWTMRLQTARQERQRAAELQRLARVARLNTMGELAAGMAHELNQPLTAMLSGTQAALRVLREAAADDDPGAATTAIPALELAAAQARRAADVVGRLRSLVRQPSIGPPVADIDLAELVQSLIGLLAPELRQRRITVRVEGTAPPVRGDRVALEQILHNLLGNAMQALGNAQGRERHIRVSLVQDGSRVDCRVQDNGPGIPAEALPRIFEPFFTTREDGLGLGLSLCQTLAQAMGGQLRAEAALPHGAVLCLSLAVASAESAAQRST